MTEPVQQITKNNFIRLGLTAFKEHELREIVDGFCGLLHIAPRCVDAAQAETDCDIDALTGAADDQGLFATSDHISDANDRIAAEAKSLVTEWLGLFDPPPQIDFQQSEFLQHGIASAIRKFAQPPHAGDKGEAVAVALLRRLCQLFDSGGESQRSVRARHASAAFQLLNREAPDYSAEQAACDADPVGYLQAAEDATLAAPQPPANGYSSQDTLKMVASMFAESVHETYTREEVVSVLEDMIRVGSPVSSTSGGTAA